MRSVDRSWACRLSQKLVSVKKPMRLLFDPNVNSRAVPTTLRKVTGARVHHHFAPRLPRLMLKWIMSVAGSKRLRMLRVITRHTESLDALTRTCIRTGPTVIPRRRESVGELSLAEERRKAV